MSYVMQHIKEQPVKWRVAPSEYDRLKEDWIKKYGYTHGFDEFFNENFILLTEKEIELRNERIKRREEVLAKKEELLKEYKALGREIDELTRESNLLLKQINWE